MRINESVINHFAQRGVNVRWYPESTYEEFKKRAWKELYDYCFNYSKDTCRELAPTEKNWCINFETLAEYEDYCKNFADNSVRRHCDPYEYTKLFIEYNGKMILKKEPVKSKEITQEYIQKLIDKNEKAYKGVYGDFAIIMQKILKENNLENNYSVYPTTYGIGVWVIYNSFAKDEIGEITKILDERGIEYYNEFSEAHWTYRFKISKKSQNLMKIK